MQEVEGAKTRGCGCGSDSGTGMTGSGTLRADLIKSGDGIATVAAPFEPRTKSDKRGAGADTRVLAAGDTRNVLD